MRSRQQIPPNDGQQIAYNKKQSIKSAISTNSLGVYPRMNIIIIDELVTQVDKKPFSIVHETQDKRMRQLRQQLSQALEQQSKHSIGYYDFLLVAKKLDFRFELSDDLMALRKHFFKHKNQLPINRFVASLIVAQQSLESYPEKNGSHKKIIVKFNVDSEEYQAIKEVTDEDQSCLEDFKQSHEQKDLRRIDSSRVHRTNTALSQMPTYDVESEDIKQKMTIILSIKVSEMIKKIKLFLRGATNQGKQNVNILNVFGSTCNQISYEQFLKTIIQLRQMMEIQFTKERMTLSEDDVKAIFFILDNNGKQCISRDDLRQFNDDQVICKKITEFYQQRINKKMVKNTFFKLGKINSTIQIYHVKNQSLLEFKNIEQSIVDSQQNQLKTIRQRIKSRVPHFGPSKRLRNLSEKKQPQQRHTQRTGNKSSLSTYKVEDTNLNKERQKIQRIIRTIGDEKKKRTQDTIASKLRKLFVHKVILPRQRMLEEEKLKYCYNRSQSHNLVVRLV